MENRKMNLMVGTRTDGTNNFRINLPAPWVKAMGATKEDKSMIISFDGDTITIKKATDEPT